MRASSQISAAATDVFQLRRKAGLFSDQRVLIFGSRRVAIDGRRLLDRRRERGIVAGETTDRAFDLVAGRFGGERACASRVAATAANSSIFIQEPFRVIIPLSIS